MKERRLWIVNEYAGSPRHMAGGGRHYNISRQLLKRGYRVSIITASYSHYLKVYPEVKGMFTREVIDEIEYIWVRVPRYSFSTDKRRVLKWFVFALCLYFLDVSKSERPDFIIFSSANSLLPVHPLYRKAGRWGAKLVFEVRDIWPLTLVELGNYSWNNPFVKLLRHLELFAIKNSDLLISLLPGYGRYLEDLGVRRDFLYLPNGISLEELGRSKPLDGQVEKHLPKERFLIGYAGAMGLANALDSFVRAARVLRMHEDIVFVLIGDGAEKSRLVREAEGLNNVLFLSPIPRDQMTSFLEKLDACYIGLRKLNLFKYGVSPNKLFEYMYCGKPVLEAIDTPESLVVKANCGINVPSENPEAIAQGVMKLYKMGREERERLGKNGREYVLENHTYERLAERLFQTLENMAGV